MHPPPTPFRTLLTIACLICALSASPQSYQLWGTTTSGGNGGGVIFHTNGEGNNFSMAWPFLENPGANPGTTRLLLASDGFFYGMTWTGGANNFGVIFRLDPITNTYTRLFDFNGLQNGMNPEGSLIQATDGKLYGLASQGGSQLVGTFFHFDPVTLSFHKILDFDGPNYGRQPQGSLLQASNGKLYGLTAYGGANDQGTVFEYDPSSGIFSRRHDFNCSSGCIPWGSLMQASNGKMYGMTSSGGNYGYGTLFEYDPSTHAVTKKHDFSGSGASGTGAYPYGDLNELASGKLYGMCYAGGASNAGVLFEYDLNSGSLSKKVDFTGTSGASPNGSLMKASSGKVYGLTQSGGTYGQGVLFEYTLSATTVSIRHHFDGASTGAQPWGTLAEASSGKLYGMTNVGGTGKGVIFSYDPSNTTLTKLLDFYGTLNGMIPKGRLVYASDGKLYGTTERGGSNGYGTIFRFDPVNRTLARMLDLTHTTGDTPIGPMMQAADGYLYGMTYAGGVYGKGVLYRFDPWTNTLIRKLNFSGTNGAHPSGGILQRMNTTKLYGMTASGGSYGYGVLFCFDYYAGTYTKLIDFDGASKGSSPLGSLIQAADGLFYGTTYTGGQYGNGVLFSFNPVNNTFVKLHDFQGQNVFGGGALPSGDLLQAADGKLYGLTFQGGNNNKGLLFSWDISTASLAKLFHFDGNQHGDYPPASLLEAPNGKLYGLTYSGGSNNMGVLFEYDPVSSSFTVRKSLDGTEGSFPVSSLIAIPCSASSASLSITSCGAYHSPSGRHTWTNSGTYSDTVLSASGCDSILTINLTVIHVDVSVLPSPHLLTAMQSGAGYQWVDCAQSFAPVAGAVQQTFSPTVSGIYAVIITLNGCRDTSICLPVQPNTGLDDIPWAADISLFPNPASDYIRLDFGKHRRQAVVCLTGPLGCRLFCREVRDQAVLDLEVPPVEGLYLVEIMEGHRRHTMKFVRTE